MTAIVPAPVLRVGPAVRVALGMVLAAALAAGVWAAGAATGSDPSRPEIVDFHAFHLAGRFALEGRFADAYDVAVMRARQADLGGRDVFMPFVYPPVFGLLMAPLALLPVAWAHLAFAGGTLALFLSVLRRLAGPWFWPALLAASPAVLIDLRLGQNGLLTGGLAGLAAALALERRGARAGLAAGALAFKPQIAILLPVLFLRLRSGRALVAAAAAGLALSAAALPVLGFGALTGFVGAAAYAGRFMAAGGFPIHRMVSLYACALGFGAPPALALALHGAGAAAVLAALLAAPPRDPRAAAGLTLMATGFVSPYLYDYDLPVVVAGLALALPALARVVSPNRLGALLALVAGAGAAGLMLNPLAAAVPAAEVSLGGPLLLLAFAAAVAALRWPAVAGQGAPA